MDPLTLVLVIGFAAMFGGGMYVAAWLAIKACEAVIRSYGQAYTLAWVQRAIRHYWDIERPPFEDRKP